MKLKRVVVPKPPPPRKHTKASRQPVKAPAQGGGADAMISQHAPGLGFDFNPADPNMLALSLSFTDTHTLSLHADI